MASFYLGLVYTLPEVLGSATLLIRRTLKIRFKHGQNAFISLKMCVCSKFNVGTLNIRGCKDPYNRNILAKDALRYDLQILSVQETHLKHQNNQGFENIVALLDSPKRSRTYNFFYCGSHKNTHHGVGLLINSALNPTFNRISDRICSAKIQLKSRCCTRYVDTLLR